MDERSFGTTRNCAGCRYWSEMIARAEGGGPVEAMCLHKSSPHWAKYVAGSQACDHWSAGDRGAVDQPAGNPYALDEPA